MLKFPAEMISKNFWHLLPMKIFWYKDCTSFLLKKEMLQDEKYFDKLFSHWYENQKERSAVKN
jgi:hypothetical protein